MNGGSWPSGSYLALCPFPLQLLLLLILLGNAYFNCLEGFAGKRTEQAAFFLGYRIRQFGHCLRHLHAVSPVHRPRTSRGTRVNCRSSRPSTDRPANNSTPTCLWSAVQRGKRRQRPKIYPHTSVHTLLRYEGSLGKLIHSFVLSTVSLAVPVWRTGLWLTTNGIR